MNNKTATLIRKYAKEVNLPYRAIKQVYNKTPRDKKFAVKQEMREKL